MLDYKAWLVVALLGGVTVGFLLAFSVKRTQSLSSSVTPYYENEEVVTIQKDERGRVVGVNVHRVVKPLA